MNLTLKVVVAVIALVLFILHYKYTPKIIEPFLSRITENFFDTITGYLKCLKDSIKKKNEERD